MLINFLLRKIKKHSMQIVFRERFDSLYQTETFKTLWCLIVASKKCEWNLHFKWGVLWNSTLPKLLGPQFFPNCMCT